MLGAIIIFTQIFTNLFFCTSTYSKMCVCIIIHKSVFKYCIHFFDTLELLQWSFNKKKDKLAERDR